MAKIPDFFGLNLGNDSIKIVQIKGGESKAKLVNIFKYPTEEGLLKNDSEEGVTLLSREVAKTIQSGKFQSKNCIISVPEVSVFSRLITLPLLEDDEVSDAINYALKPLVPIPLENVNVSFLEINREEVDGKTVVNWYVVAAPKQLIARLQLVIESAGMTLLAIETEALAIARMVQYNYQSEDVNDIMILDLGAESTNLILARKGVVIFSQNIGTGSDSLTKVIAADFGLDQQLAERYKIAYGLNTDEGDGKIAQSIKPVVEIMLSEIQRTLVYYKEKIKGKGISKIFLTGGGAHLIKLDEYINSKLALPCEVVNPFKNIYAEKDVLTQIPNTSVNTFNVALGLALKGFL